MIIIIIIIMVELLNTTQYLVMEERSMHEHSQLLSSQADCMTNPSKEKRNIGHGDSTNSLIINSLVYLVLITESYNNYNYTDIV